MSQPVSFPAADARLITRVSADRAGLGDYVTKRDWRRDLDEDCRREGYDYFWPNNSGAYASDPGLQPFPNGATTTDPITLIHLARRPNGTHAILAATKTTIWRFFAFDNGAYYEGTGANSYYEEPPAANAPYYADQTGEWVVIGSGFSSNGHRWEALDINGYTILNNGIDLPMTYRIEESAVLPIYELREQGIAAVGTIGETNGILVCGDISQIHDAALLTLMSPTGDIDTGNMTAFQDVTQMKTPADFFVAGHLGRTVVWDNGSTGKILNIVGPREAQLDSHSTQTNQKFKLRNKATQAGATFSGLITGSVAIPPGNEVIASDVFFDGTMVGKTIRFSNGFSATITSFTSATIILIGTNPPEPIVGLPFWITTASSLTLVSDSAAFNSGMVGKYIVFDTGEVRQIIGYVNSTTVTVDSDGAIASTFFRIENTSSYLAYTDPTNIDRIQFRLLWSMPDEPRRFGAIILGTIAAGEQSVELQFPSRSFEAGQEIIVAGAGTDGGNITTTILSVNELGRRLLLSQLAETTATDQPVEQSDANGSIVGFEDLQDDSSAVLRILALSDVLIIYKETCIFQAVYTGDVTNPFDFKRLKMPKGIALYYRWTLIDVGGQFHLYAGANSFYRFDLSSRIPRIVPELDLVSDKFFSQVALSVTDQIFAADNSITNEVFFWFPSTSGENGLCFDYKQVSASSTSMAMTAAATVKRPVTGAAGSEDLFVMGNAQGAVLVYGKSDALESAWGNVKEIFYRRSAYPFTASKSGYDSILETGWGEFGQPHYEKDLTNYVLYLASQSPNCGLQLKLYGTRNPSEPSDLLLASFIPSPRTENLVPMFFRAHYFKTNLTVSGSNNPCRVTAQQFDIDYIRSDSHERRP